MHDTVIRHHGCRALAALCAEAGRFLEAAQPFPSAGHAGATMAV
jgi:hypothetical protein